MAFVIDIIRHTPPYVWLVMLLIGWRMIRNFRTRWISLRALLIPAVLLVVLGVAASSVRSGGDAIGWLAMACLAGPLGFFTAPHPIEVDRSRGRLQVPGSLLFAIRLPAIFLMRYGLAVAQALHPDRQAELSLATSLFSGLVAGYYLGWIGFLLRAYWRAPQAKPEAACGEGMAPIP